METTFGLLLLTALLQIVFGENFMPQSHHNNEQFPENQQMNSELVDESEVVGNAARARIRAHNARARARAIARATKLLPLQHPFLLEETPEQFLSADSPIIESHSSFDRSEPILGSSGPVIHSPAQFMDDPIVASAQYGVQPEYSTPQSWYPAPYNHEHNYYNNDGVLSILPGQWKDNDYPQEYYESYQVTPVEFQIPDYYQGEYRNADPHKHKKNKKGKKLMREGNEDGDLGQRTFKKHVQAQSHALPYHDHVSYDHHGHESFSSNGNYPSYGQHFANEQKNVIVLPPHSENYQISQAGGNHNAVSQYQASSHLPNTYTHHQTSHIAGHNSAGSQFQAPYVGSIPDPVVGAPNIIKVPRSRKIFHIAGPDEADISVVIKRSVPSLNRQKRSPQLGRLLLDPNAKMDIPKTIENAGTAVRNSFENKRAPTYHLRNAMGSARDVFMSSLRIPTQDLFIPSKYRIVEKNAPVASRVLSNGISKEQPNETYNKMGTMFRESIRSGKDTMGHIGDFVHSARKVLFTAPHVAPRMVISSFRVPAVQHPLISGLQKEKQHEAEHPDFISVPRAMDSFDLSKPNKPNVVFAPTIRSDDEEPSQQYVVFSDTFQEGLHKTLSILDGALKAIGADTLKGFFEKIKEQKRSNNENPSIIGIKSSQNDLFNRSENSQSSEDEVVGAINPEMFKKVLNISLESAENDAQKNTDDDQSVGISMQIGKKLMKPFMGKLDKVEVPGYTYEDADSDEDYYDEEYKK